MSSRIKIVAILVAWLLTTGAQWDVVQTVGWARMIARYADTMSFAQAVKKTLNAELCGICEAVDDARQHHERALPGDLAKAKCVLVCQSVPVWVFAMPEANRWSLSDSEFVSSLRPVPPTPPPRAV